MNRTLRLVTYTTFLGVVWAYGATGGARVFADSGTWFLCENVCGETTACDESCYENMMEHENGNDITCLEWGDWDYSQTCCGDYVCNLSADESCANCVNDCGLCLVPPTCEEDGCQQGENCMNCPADCGPCGTSETCNNDGKCQTGEDLTCEDCQFTGFCVTQNDCPDHQGNGYHYTCVDDRCILSDLPLVTNNCSTDANCPIGWKCKDIPESYHGSTYVCPGTPPAENCKVCIPSWVH